MNVKMYFFPEGVGGDIGPIKSVCTTSKIFEARVNDEVDGDWIIFPQIQDWHSRKSETNNTGPPISFNFLMTATR